MFIWAHFCVNESPRRQLKPPKIVQILRTRIKPRENWYAVIFRIVEISLKIFYREIGAWRWQEILSFFFLNINKTHEPYFNFMVIHSLLHICVCHVRVSSLVSRFVFLNLIELPTALDTDIKFWLYKPLPVNLCKAINSRRECKVKFHLHKFITLMFSYWYYFRKS